MYEKHQQGISYNAEVKQTALNVYQGLRKKGHSMNDALEEAADLVGIRRPAIELFLKEKVWGSTLKVRN